MKKLVLVFIANIITVLIWGQVKSDYKYLFVAHTYMGETIVDSRLLEYNKDIFDNIWLGGDICSETLMYKPTLEYLQTNLKINDPHNYWTLGNHDRRNGNIEWFEQYTGKKAYYADYNNGITTIVLDTNLDPSDCENLNNQYRMICNVTDTISASSHLIMLFHWGLWSGIPGLPEPYIYGHTNLKYWNSNCDSTNTNFATLIYPKLVDVKNRGVDVICIMGDMGASYKKFAMKSTDNITFLGCGLNNIIYMWEPNQWWTNEKDLILELNHNVTNKTITWQFKDLDSLVDVQRGYKYLEKLTFDDFENYPTENTEFVQHENYIYKFNNVNDSLVVLNANSENISALNNEILITGVFKSLTENPVDQIKIISQLFNDDILIEQQEQINADIPTSLKYYQDTVAFTSPIQSSNKLVVYIKTISSVPVFLNNVMVKYKMQ
jgi:hypothetical protein